MGYLVNSIQLSTSFATTSLGQLATGRYIQMNGANFPSGTTFRFVAHVSNIGGIGSGTIRLRRKGTTTDDATLSPDRMGFYSTTFTAWAASMEYELYIGAPYNGTITVDYVAVEAVTSATTIDEYEGNVLLQDSEFYTNNTTPTEINAGYWYFDPSDYPSGLTFKFRAWLKVQHGTAASNVKLQRWTGSTWIDAATLSGSYTTYSWHESNALTLSAGKYRVVGYRSGSNYAAYVAAAQIFVQATSAVSSACLARRVSADSDYALRYDGSQWGAEKLYLRGMYNGTSFGNDTLFLYGLSNGNYTGTYESVSSGSFSVHSPDDLAYTGGSEDVYIKNQMRVATCIGSYVTLLQIGSATYNESSTISGTSASTLAAIADLPVAISASAATDQVQEPMLSMGVTTEANANVGMQLIVAKTANGAIVYTASASDLVSGALSGLASVLLDATAGAQSAMQLEIPASTLLDAAAEQLASVRMEVPASVLFGAPAGEQSMVALDIPVSMLFEASPVTQQAISLEVPVVALLDATATGQQSVALDVPIALLIEASADAQGAVQAAFPVTALLEADAGEQSAVRLDFAAAALVKAAAAAQSTVRISLPVSVLLDASAQTHEAALLDALAAGTLAGTASIVFDAANVVDTLTNFGATALFSGARSVTIAVQLAESLAAQFSGTSTVVLDASATAVALASVAASTGQTYFDTASVAGTAGMTPGNLLSATARLSLSMSAAAGITGANSITLSVAAGTAASMLSQVGLDIEASAGIPGTADMTLGAFLSMLAAATLGATPVVDVQSITEIASTLQIESTAAIVIQRAVDVLASALYTAASTATTSPQLAADGTVVFTAQALDNAHDRLDAVAATTLAAASGLSASALRQLFSELSLPAGTTLAAQLDVSLVTTLDLDGAAEATPDSVWTGFVETTISAPAGIFVGTGSVFMETVQFSATAGVSLSHLAELAAAAGIDASASQLLDSILETYGDAQLSASAAQTLLAFIQAYPESSFVATGGAQVALSSGAIEVAVGLDVSAGAGAGSGMRLSLTLSEDAIAALAAAGQISAELAATLDGIAMQQQHGTVTGQEAMAAAATAIQEQAAALEVSQDATLTAAGAIALSAIKAANPSLDISTLAAVTLASVLQVEALLQFDVNAEFAPVLTMAVAPVSVFVIPARPTQHESKARRTAFVRKARARCYEAEQRRAAYIVRNRKTEHVINRGRPWIALSTPSF